MSQVHQKSQNKKNLYTLLTPSGEITKKYKDGEILVIKHKKIQTLRFSTNNYNVSLNNVN